MGSRTRGEHLSTRHSQPSAEADLAGDARDRSRLTIEKFILPDDEDRHEYYIQVVLSRKAAALIVLFLTVVVSLVEFGCRIVIPGY